MNFMNKLSPPEIRKVAPGRLPHQWAEIKIWAERKAGEILKGIKREKGKRTDTTSSSDCTRYEEVLKENDLASSTANNWQRESDMPEEDFEQRVAEVNESGDELTSVAILKEIKAKEKIVH